MMSKVLVILFAFSFLPCVGQVSKTVNEETLLQKVLADPSQKEINEVLSDLRKQDLFPKDVIVHDSIDLSNSNRLYIVSHRIEGRRHYGAVVIPKHTSMSRLPVIIFATGGDGMNPQFDITQDLNHKAVQFPNFLGGRLDSSFIVAIPSFRGQQLIVGDKTYSSDGSVADAFDGAATDAIAFLNATLNAFPAADKSRIGIYGGSRGGTVALLASARDKRIKRAIAVAAPTDMKELYRLYPDQFKLLFFNDLLTGKISSKEARKKFISCSPIYFTKELPPVQLHHDKNDPFVPVAFAVQLVDTMKADGKEVVLYFYSEGIHGFWADDNYWRRVQAFILGLSE